MTAGCTTGVRGRLLAELVAGLPATVLGRSDIPVSGITCDSRTVRPGFLFAALPGTQRHGTEFIPEALSRGASVILAPKAFMACRGASLVVAEDVRAALAAVAARYWEEPSRKLPVVGVTGTNGKTTVAFLVRWILEEAGTQTGLVGTVEYIVGRRRIPAIRTTPEAPELQALLAEMVRCGCRAAVMEVSSHALDQKRADAVHFTVAAFTNLSRDHLDYHHSMEDYYQAKKRLTELAAAAGGVAVINDDCPWGRRLASEMEGRMRVVRCSVQREADYRAEDVSFTPAGSRFRLRGRRWPAPGMEVTLRLPGDFNLSNALLALAISAELGVEPAAAAGSLSRFRRIPGRMEEIQNDRGFRVFVDYAHTADALERVLRLCRSLARGRVIVVFGCGGERDRGKRPLMGRVAGALADVVILTSDNPRGEDPEAIIRDIETGLPGIPHQKVVDRREGIQAAIECARPGDIVLIAGRGHEAYQDLGRRLIPFDDREVAAVALGKTGPRVSRGDED